LELDDPHLAPDSGLVEARELLRADAELFVGLTMGSLTVAQPFLCAASRRDATGDLSGADDGPVCVPYGRDRDSDVDRSSVLVQALSLELIDRPIASSAVHPKRRCAAAFHERICPSRSLLMIASSEESTIAAKCASAC